MASHAELTQRITRAIEPAVTSAGLYLEEATVGRAGQQKVVRVTVDLPDGPGGVGSDALTQVSRDISAILDDVDLIEGAHTLEVSTPGAERPLTKARHFRRAEGRLVEVTADGERVVGRVTACRAETVELEVDGKTTTIPLSAITQARVQVELNRPADAK